MQAGPPGWLNKSRLNKSRLEINQGRHTGLPSGWRIAGFLSGGFDLLQLPIAEQCQ